MLVGESKPSSSRQSESVVAASVRPPPAVPSNHPSASNRTAHHQRFDCPVHLQGRPPPIHRPRSGRYGPSQRVAGTARRFRWGRHKAGFPCSRKRPVQEEADSASCPPQQGTSSSTDRGSQDRLVGLPASHGVATSNSTKDPAKSHAGKSPTAPLRSRTIHHDRLPCLLLLGVGNRLRSRVPVMVWSMSDAIPTRGTSNPLLPQLDSAFDPATIPVGVSRDIGLLISVGTTGLGDRRLVVGECCCW